MKRAFKWLIGFLVFLIVWAFGAPFLAKNLIVEKPLEKADAILVLAGAHTYVERTQKAAELFRKGVAPRIYLTDDGEFAGWSRVEQRNPPFVELARAALIAGGVAAENIEVLKPPVTGTISEARVLSERARTANLKSILIVTSAYHTRRAFSTFRKIFTENEQTVELGIASPPAGINTPPPSRWWLSPIGWQIVAGEYVKSVGYWVYY